jgi:hypothetical protein
MYVASLLIAARFCKGSQTIAVLPPAPRPALLVQQQKTLIFTLAPEKNDPIFTFRKGFEGPYGIKYVVKKASV